MFSNTTTLDSTTDQDLAISVQGVCKSFQIYDNPGDRLKQFIRPRVDRLLGRPARQYFREFKALDDVSFTVKKGETVGIIGRNGSGKSTLLQIICGTLTPTSGEVRVHGRVAALLELGSGFNPEFTGRENVYLNAAVLGLTKEEVDARFDKIAAFADIGQFMEQPVKIYSSGMYVKLAFAVIAHVDADILVIDEALAVGDAVFIQKCMRFIRSFQERGTLLFVSHDTASVQNLCKSSIWLYQGQVRQMGNSKEVAESYLHYTQQEIYGNDIALRSIKAENSDKAAPVKAASDTDTNTNSEKPLLQYGEQVTVKDNLIHATGWKTDAAEIISINLLKVDGSGKTLFEGGEVVRLVIKANAKSDLASPILGFILKDRLGQDIFGENTLPFTTTNPRPVLAGQSFAAEFEFRLPMLPNGQFAVFASVADGDLYNNLQHHFVHDALILNIASSRIRWGLVGIPFQKVSLEICDD